MLLMYFDIRVHWILICLSTISTNLHHNLCVWSNASILACRMLDSCSERKLEIFQGSNLFQISNICSRTFLLWSVLRARKVTIAVDFAVTAVDLRQMVKSFFSASTTDALIEMRAGRTVKWRNWRLSVLSESCLQQERSTASPVYNITCLQQVILNLNKFLVAKTEGLIETKR